MGKNKKEKPELTLENLNRAIRTYQQLASLQNMEILQSVAKQENFLDPEIFCNQSDSSVIKNHPAAHHDPAAASQSPFL